MEDRGGTRRPMESRLFWLDYYCGISWEIGWLVAGGFRSKSCNGGFALVSNSSSMDKINICSLS
jgi:hypothetical protein